MRGKRGAETVTFPTTKNAPSFSTIFSVATGSCSELCHDLSYSLACLVLTVGWEADRAYASMPAAAVALADRSEVHQLRRHQLRPGVRSNRHLRPKARFAQAHVVGRVRMQAVRDEFVVALGR